MEYDLIITNLGMAIFNDSIVNNTEINFKYIVVGDANGVPYEPSETQTEIVNEVYRNLLESTELSTGNDCIIIQAFIPAEAGGFWMREIGILDENENLIMVAAFPEQYKPNVEGEKTAEDLRFKYRIQFSNADSLNLTLQPSVNLIARDEFEELSNNAILKDGSVDFEANQSMGGFKLTDVATPTENEDAVNKEYVDNNSGSSVAIGTVDYITHEDVPEGWMIADGSSISATTYPELFSIVGYTFGGSGSNYQLPDLRGIFIRGLDLGRGIDVDRVLGSFQDETVGPHKHNIAVTGGLSSVDGVYSFHNGGVDYLQISTTGFGIGTETRPKNIALTPIVKVYGVTGSGEPAWSGDVTFNINGLGASSLASNGYQELSSGLIFQWGTFTSDSDIDIDVTFPDPFPTMCFAVFPGDNTANDDTHVGWSPNSVTTAGFKANRDDVNSGSFTLKYFAIGR